MTLKQLLIAALTLQGVTAESSDQEVIDAVNKKFGAANNSQTNFLKNVIKSAGLKVEDEVTEESVLNSLTASLTVQTDRVNKLEDDVKVENAKKLKAVLDIAQNDHQKINDEQRKEFEVIAEKAGIDTVMTVLDGLPAREKISDGLEADGVTGAKDQSMSQMVYARLAEMDKEQAGV